MTTLNLTDLFNPADLIEAIEIDRAKRLIFETDNGHFLIDRFNEVESLFIRIPTNATISLVCEHAYTFEQTDYGGYLGKPFDPQHPQLWVPLPPIERCINSDSQILSEHTSSLLSFSWNEQNGVFKLKASNNGCLDLIIWRFPNRSSDFFDKRISKDDSFELQNCFLWGSHKSINKPADLYRHLINGYVYDLRYSWPNNKKCFSENEAHALYTVYSGLEKATGKAIYRHFQLQLVLSIVQRQAEDGGWYHGMWTDSSECHYRLHTSGVHLLMDEYARTGCPNVKVALEKAVVFLSKTTDQLSCGAWFLHDSLELSKEAMDKGPFKWIPNTTLGKRISNMLVLNTHLDSTIAMNRYAQLTKDHQFDELIVSALNSTKVVLSLKKAEWLYKPLFWAIGLTMLPTEQAMRLPLALRAIKRFASDYLIKKVPDIKAKFPRLAMPNGYIDRELSLRTWAIDYQTINLMDLARHAYSFPQAFDEIILDKAMEFTQTSGLIKRYRELTPDKRYSVGFWSEALYYRCLAKPDIKYRQWLAEAILECHDLDFGLSPSLLGTNGEAMHYDQQVSMPLTDNPELLMANLSVGQNKEFIMVNSSDSPVTVAWTSKPDFGLTWLDSKGKKLSNRALIVNNRDWIMGIHQNHQG
ncbi:hypothetical protein GO003_015610 [Methylicorpusculum oleiharenae]|uniref:hypothetical protein n=1 Tax=Methylicorpusculum oleiharenae TaxID=1338687 RepID=UPI00135BED5B|nr:hypothetical protein [Methylicorpusculum oleiharenae]MCD2451814.1 hypothetical protein [Methylicorpusculum oleiharenae]